jgi:hypothetical protein
MGWCMCHRYVVWTGAVKADEKWHATRNAAVAAAGNLVLAKIDPPLSMTGGDHP